MKKSWRNIIENISIWIVAAIFLFFVVQIAFYGLRESYISWDHYFERLNFRPQNVSDTVWGTVKFFAIYVGIGVLLYFLSKVINEKIIVGFFMIVSFGISLTWVLYGKVYPQADPYMAYNAALELYGKEVSESFLKYATVYKQQFGLITLYHFLFWFTGKVEFQTLQVVNALAVPFIIMFSYKITKKLTEGTFAAGLSLPIVGSCIPMYLYTTYAYGETLSILFSLIDIYLVLVLLKADKLDTKKLILLNALIFTCSFLAILVRMNTLVVIIALMIVVFIKAITGKQYAKLTVFACLILSFILEGLYIDIRYKDVLKDNPPMPAILWIAMGMQDSVDDENYIGPGAYNSLNWNVFKGTDYNVELSKEIAHLVMDARIEEFTKDPKYAIRFYRDKLLIQWNVPIYQSIFMNGAVYESDKAWAYDWIHTPEVGVANDKFMEIYHSMIFFGAIFGAIGSLIKKKRLEDYLIPVVLVGGFLFSLLWEAKPRYVYPYFVILLPYATVGIAYLAYGIKYTSQKLLCLSEKLRFF